MTWRRRISDEVTDARRDADRRREEALEETAKYKSRVVELEVEPSIRTTRFRGLNLALNLRR